ncbi:MAG: hypothetical protein M1818_008483 [Claussenomyces sp. TS43310]|nr:MAG: hypothetical protein M1818_008483 [Claussenomyces sp. TS43310]
MSADSVRVVEGFVTAVQSLAADGNYKELKNVFEEISQLKAQIATKDAALKGATQEIDSLKARHMDDLGKNLELYTTRHNKLDAEKAKLSGEIATLTETAKQREIAVAELNQGQDKLKQQLGQIKKTRDDEVKKIIDANKAITQLQQKLKAKDVDLNKLKENLHNEKAQASNTKSQVGILQGERTSLHQDLRSKSAKLNELEGFTMKLQEVDEEEWITRWNQVWESARQLVESNLMEDLPEKSFEVMRPIFGDLKFLLMRMIQNLHAWKRLEEFKLLGGPIPLPRSNSSAAKRMRVALMLAVLARRIDEHIFLPTYILEDDEIRPLLERLAIANSSKESFCRALLLSLFPEKQARNATQRVGQVVREVAYYVQDFLSVTQNESFRTGLEKVVRQACEVWRIAQHAVARFEPTFELTCYDDFHWQPLKFVENAEPRGQSPQMASARDEERLVIFPRVYYLEDGQRGPITNGVVLMESQSIAAAQEMEKSSSSAAGKLPSRPRPSRPRTMSRSINGTIPFLSQATPSSVH